MKLLTSLSWSTKWKRTTAKTTKINRVTTPPHHNFGHYCRDLNGWSSVVIFTAFWFCIPVVAQTPAAKPGFSVASIKLSEPDEHAYIRWLPGGRIKAEHVPLRFLIRFAWNLSDDRIVGGPSWVSDESFDIEAVPNEPSSEPNNGNERVRVMLRSLLIDRFHMAYRLEPRDVSAYVLTVAKTGLRLKTSRPDQPRRVNESIDGDQRKIAFYSYSSATIAATLSAQLKQTVVDRTGLDGEFDGMLEFSPALNTAESPSGPSLFTAVQEQFGLRLQVETTLLDVLVIDSVRKPDPN